MAENEELEFDEEEIEIPDVLEELLVFAINDAKERLKEDGELAPFTATLVRETVYFDTILGETPDEMYDLAAAKVAEMDGLTAYAFCYDGWVEGDESDALICEGGLPGEPAGYAVCSPYSVSDAGEYDFTDEILFIGDAPNYAEELSEPDPWDPEDEED